MDERSNFVKFTERARKVLSLAEEEARRFQHNYIGTEHLLLGLVREGEGVAAKVLSNRGIELNKVRAAVENIIGRGDRIVLGEIGLTPRARRVVEFAIDEATRMNHHYVGTEHLLLGLIHEGEGIAAGILESQGVRLDDIRIETIAVLSRFSIWQAQTPTQTSEVEGKEQAGVSQQNLQDEEDLTPAPSTGSNDISDIFSIRAKRVVDAALEEAQRFQHHYVGPEHLLLSLLREEKGPATQILNNLGVERAKVDSAVEFIINRGVKYSVLGEIKLTPRSHKVLRLAIDEARSLNDTLIGTEHLLLGMLREGEGIAAGVLASMNVYVENARSELKRIRDTSTGNQESQ